MFDTVLKAAIFDMDGLMLDTEPIALSALRESCAQFGYKLIEEHAHGVLGLTSDSSLKYLKAVFGSKFPGNEVRLRMREIYYSKIEPNGAPLKPGILAMLDFLSGAGLPLAVVTSTRRQAALYQLEKAGLSSYFTAFIGGDEVTNGKPHPEPYLKAIDILKVLQNETVAFEDSENGVRSAKAAGLRVIMVPDLKLPSEEIRGLADFVCESLVDARRLLQLN